MREYYFQFEDSYTARLFVGRVCLTMKDVAMYVDARFVKIFDGSEFDRRQRIYRLASVSGDKWRIVKGPLGVP